MKVRQILAKIACFPNRRSTVKPGGLYEFLVNGPKPDRRDLDTRGKLEGIVSDTPWLILIAIAIILIWRYNS